MSKQKGDESAFGVADGSASVFIVSDWVKDIIEGPQGMNSFQRTMQERRRLKSRKSKSGAKKTSARRF